MPDPPQGCTLQGLKRNSGPDPSQFTLLRLDKLPLPSFWHANDCSAGPKGSEVPNISQLGGSKKTLEFCMCGTVGHGTKNPGATCWCKLTSYWQHRVIFWFSSERKPVICKLFKKELPSVLVQAVVVLVAWESPIFFVPKRRSVTISESANHSNQRLVIFSANLLSLGFGRKVNCSSPVLLSRVSVSRR